MNSGDSPVVLRTALRNLAEDARREAALVRLDSDDHDFYEGVMAAAEDRLHLEMLGPHDESWLGRAKPAFREGYTKTSAVIASVHGDPPHHLSLPTRDPGR
jgi:hypothetical protein